MVRSRCRRMGTAHPSSELAVWGHFKRLNEAEPFLAIRLALIQGAMAFGLFWVGEPRGQVPEEFVEFPASFLGLFDEASVIFLGYPLREVVWSGEWWRLIAGVALPPSLGWFAFSLIAFLPFAKVLEERLSRIHALAVYLLGGVITLTFDFLTSPTPTAGGLGMVFAAGGAVVAIRMSDSREKGVEPTSIPTSAWMSLLLLGGLAWISTEGAVLLAQSSIYSGMTEISPTPLALALAGVTGFATALPLHSISEPRMGEDEEDPHGEEIPVSRGVGWKLALPAAWMVLLVGYGGYEWRRATRVDWTLWRIEPQLRRGDADAFRIAEGLLTLKPEDAFLQKRIAVAHAVTGNYPQARDLLENLSRATEAKKGNKTHLRAEALRRLRAFRLNRRDSKTLLPWRHSGFSSNYDTDSLRLLWDRGHVARLQGASDELATVRTKLMAAVEQFAPASNRVSKELSNGARWREAMVLNHRAYVRAELGGDVRQASKEATIAVSLSPTAENLDTLGWVLVKLNRPENAVPLLERALLFEDPDSAGTIHYHLGRALGLLGEEEGSRKHFGSALSFDLEWWEELDIAARCPSCLEVESSL